MPDLSKEVHDQLQETITAFLKTPILPIDNQERVTKEIEAHPMGPMFAQFMSEAVQAWVKAMLSASIAYGMLGVTVQQPEKPTGFMKKLLGKS